MNFYLSIADFEVFPKKKCILSYLSIGLKSCIYNTTLNVTRELSPCGERRPTAVADSRSSTKPQMQNMHQQCELLQHLSQNAAADLSALRSCSPHRLEEGRLQLALSQAEEVSKTLNHSTRQLESLSQVLMVDSSNAAFVKCSTARLHTLGRTPFQAGASPASPQLPVQALRELFVVLDDIYKSQDGQLLSKAFDFQVPLSYSSSHTETLVHLQSEIFTASIRRVMGSMTG